MATKRHIAGESCMIDRLLVAAHSVDLFQLSFVALLDSPHQRPLLPESFFWSLEADEGGCPNIASSNGVVQGQDVWLDCSGVGGGGRQMKLDSQATDVVNIL